MTPEEFDALLKRRDELRSEHETACAIHNEEHALLPVWVAFNETQYRECVRLHLDLVELQEQIDAELEAERLGSNAEDGT